MEYALLGWADAGVTLRLDYRRFSYAGKFVMSATGKAVARTASPATDGGSERADAADRSDGSEDDYDDGVLAAVAFDADRTDETVCRLRYITVREDRRGEGIGPRLAAFVAARATDRGFERVRIAVNNPYAYEALYRAGFAFTGAETGLAELVLERPAGRGAVADRDPDTYRRGLDVYRERDLSTAEREFLRGKEGSDPPSVVATPGGPGTESGRR